MPPKLGEVGTLGRFRAKIVYPSKKVPCFVCFTRQGILCIRSFRFEIAHRIALSFLYAISIVWTIIFGSPPLPDSMVFASDSKNQTELERRGEFMISKASIEELTLVLQPNHGYAALVISLRSGGALQIELLPISSRENSLP